MGVYTRAPDVTPPQPAPSEEIAATYAWQPTLAFLRYTVVAILAASAVFIFIIFVFLPDQIPRALGPGMLSLVALTSWGLLRRGRTRDAVLLLAGGVWISVTVIATLYGGIRSTIYYVYPLVIFLLGWMISTTAAVGGAATTTAGTNALILADARGWLPASLPAEPVLYGVVQIFVYLLTAAMVIYLVQAYRRQLQALQQVSEDMRRANAVLRQSELKFATAFSSSPAAASIATLAEGRLIEANANFERDFGWSISDLRGITAMDAGLWPDASQRELWVNTLKQHGRTVNYETVWRHRNGELRHVSIAGEIIDLDGVPCILAYTTDITARKAAEEEIQRLAFFDPLTKLPNRRLLMDRLEQAMAACARHQRLGALLFIDLDNFKTLNDTHGHDKGDLLLQQVSARLADGVREGDTVARLGGDEFVVMIEDLAADAMTAAKQAENVGRKIMAALNEPYDIRPLQVHSTPSMGITLFGAQHENLEEPIKRADLAMYQAKNAGRNTLRFFDPRMQAMVTARANLEHDLRLALQLQQFVLHFQPQVQRGGRVTGAEVLLRWPHPERGLVPPGEFITLAEETGLILPLGERVLEQACRQLALWATQPAMAHLTLSVNVSARQFQKEDFVDGVLAVLERTGAPPQRLMLELTESLLISNIDDVIRKMDALKARGPGFALDDFGTGYSSLSYLKRLPLNQLKIDQGFVRDILVDPNDAAIARMVIVLGESLGLEVLAEGVETPAQQQALQAQGCHAYQGYLYSRPVPLEAFEALARQPGWPVIEPRP
uniref:putative bifunctional diguanylate cyclase/phosphodiesterase n=1 Tax=Hylemonella sp. TaxID=2066020 RepID=UPI0035B329EA